MRTTLNVDDGLFRDLLIVTRARTKTEAVGTALTEYSGDIILKSDVCDLSKQKDSFLYSCGKVTTSTSHC